MSNTVKYTRYYFPSVLRWIASIILLLLAGYLAIIGWFIAFPICLLCILILWTFKYVVFIDQKKKHISEEFHRMAIPFGETRIYNKLNKLVVTREKKSYKAASRSRDYWVNYVEYSLHINYDNKQLLLFTMNDHDAFEAMVKKFAEQLSLRVDSK